MILRRRESDRFSEVVREWEGGMCVVLGGGSSLTRAQVGLVSAAHLAGAVNCIAVNDAYLWAPWADVNYFADSQFWEWQSAGIEKPLIGLTADQVRERFVAFPGQKCSIQNSGANIKDDAVHILRNKSFPAQHGVGLSADPGALISGRNSGWQAINLAILAGAKTIVLLGFDGRPGSDGKQHWFGDHPRPTPAAFYEAMRKAFSAGEAAIKDVGVRVVNCSPGSAIDSFTKMDLAEVL